MRIEWRSLIGRRDHAAQRVAAPERLRAGLNAKGAMLSERAVCHDRRVLTARGADDLPEFFQAVLASMQEKAA